MLLDAGNIKAEAVTRKAFPPLLSHSGGGRWATSTWMCSGRAVLRLERKSKSAQKVWEVFIKVMGKASLMG